MTANGDKFAINKGIVDSLKELSQEQLQFLMYYAQIDYLMKLKDSNTLEENKELIDRQITGLSSGMTVIRSGISTDKSVSDKELSDTLLAKVGIPGNPGVQIIQEAYVKKMRGE